MANDDVAYAAWLRTRPCCQCGGHPVQVHHRTGAGLALRASDRDAMPLCAACHRAFHDANGPFKGWVREQCDAWQTKMIVKHLLDYSNQVTVEDEWMPY